VSFRLKLILFCAFFINSKSIFAASKSNEGMPQLDVSTYPSLIFWLVITFGFTILVLKFYITPKMYEILNQRKEKIDTDLFEAKKSREDAENSKLNQESSILEAKEKAFQIISEATEKSKRDAQSFEKNSKEKLLKKLTDAEKGITNAKNESLKVVNEIATDIAISLSQKVSGIKANKSILMKKINEQVSRSGSYKSLKEGN
jgi:F-type H+-transporting ATPase subunit b